jgi:dienelactone hydrolase
MPRLRAAVSLLLIAIVGCSSSGASNAIGGNGPNGPPTPGATDAGASGGPGSQGGADLAIRGGGGGLDGSIGPTDGGVVGTSKCGAPLDAFAPTAASIVKDGPYSVTSYSNGLPPSSAYKSLTVFYPTTASGPFVVVMLSPGLTEVLQYLRPWAQRFASYGYVAVFVEANDTNNDSEATRADGMWAGIGAIKGESTRGGSPLAGKLSGCIVTSGHSLGGGASISIANAHPHDVTAALAFNPYDATTNFSSIVAPTLIITGQNDTTAPPAQHGRRHYDSMSSSIVKEYVEIQGGAHTSAIAPGTIPGQYAVSWIKLNVDGDTRYRPFLAKATSGLSDFATTLLP